MLIKDFNPEGSRPRAEVSLRMEGPEAEAENLGGFRINSGNKIGVPTNLH